MATASNLLQSTNATRAPLSTIEEMIAPHIAGHEIVAYTVLVTPELAKRLLAYNLQGNRRTPATAIAKLGRVIGTNKWKLNGESLKFSVENILIDGQTRLKTCIETGRPFITVVLFGVPDDAYDSLDQGRKRKVEDALTRHGVQNARVTASAIMAIDAISHREVSYGGTGRWHGSDADEAIKFVEDNPRIADSVVATHTAAKLAPHSLLAALHYHFYDLSPEEANRFFADLGSGIDLGEKDPVRILREKLFDDIQKRAQRRDPVSRWNVSAWVILAWNARRRHKPMSKFPSRLLVKNEDGRLILPIIG